jgi:hypothetical protein
VALAALASAAIAASPELSPVPTECTGIGCTSSGSFGAGKGEALGYWHFGGGIWKWSNLSVPAGASYEAWNEGTTIRNLRLTFENFNCRNEGLNFTTEPLKGRLGVVEGKSAVLLEPETGSTIGKCTYSGSPWVMTGSYIAEIFTSEGRLHLQFSGAGLRRLTPLEAEHVISDKVEGASGSYEASLEGTTSVPATGLELKTAGRTATFATPKYAGGFALNGGSMVFQATNGLKVTCKYTSGSGQFTSATGGYAYLSFAGCKGPLGSTCTGWESLARLKVQLAYTYPATETPEGRQTALVLSPESGGNINEIECGGVKSANKGAVMGVISPLAKAASTFGLSFKQLNGVEEHTQYEFGGESWPAVMLTSTEEGKWSQSGLEVKTPVSIYLNAGGEETIK